jgi:hypothetical protein
MSSGAILTSASDSTAPNHGTMAVGGLNVPAPQVVSALAELAAFQGNFEKVFLALAQSLPDLSRSIEELSGHFNLVHGHHGNVATKVEAQVDQMVRASKAATENVLTHSKTGLAAAASLGTVATSLAQRLAAGQEASATLRLAGMNASFTVRGLGPEGAAFSAVNRALIDVADEASFLTQKMGATAQVTRVAADELGVAQRALAEKIAEATSATEAGSLSAMRACSIAVESLDSELGAVVARGLEVARATGAVMLALQQQDILRQGIDHVTLVLQTLQTEFARVAGSDPTASAVMAFLAFQARAGGLAADLLKSLREHLEALVVAVNELVEGIKKTAGVIAERLSDHDSIDRSLSSPADQFAEGFAGLPVLDAPLKRCDDGAGHIHSQLTVLRPRLLLLEQIPLQIGLVAVLMKMEIAHTDALAGAGSVAEDLREVSRSFRNLHLTAMDAIDVVEHELALLCGAVQRQRSSWASLRSLPASIEQAALRVRAIATSFGTQLVALAGAAMVLEQEAGTLHRGLLAFGESLASTDAIRETCARFRDDAERLRADLLERGYELADAPDSLRALIERFTLFEHKVIARGATDPTREQHGKPGELTFF